MKDFLKSIAFRVLVLVAALLVGMMVYAASVGGVSTLPETVVGFVVTPLQSAAAAIGDGFDRFIGLFTDGGELRRENAQLKEEVNALREQQVELDELRSLPLADSMANMLRVFLEEELSEQYYLQKPDGQWVEMLK